MSDNIKVVVKVRPLIRREIEEKLLHQWRVNNNALVQIDQNGRECGTCFTFDKVYDEGTKTSDVFNDIAKPIVEAATAGFNGTIFAYGQTSSGKTYTMTGTDDSPGIIPLAILNLFDIIKNVPDRDFLIRVSYVEIYNESLTDLLDLKKVVKIHETFNGIRVDTTEKVTTSPEEVLEVMREGKANRQTGTTNMNEESSRSHSIFQITIESREHIEGEEEVGSVNVSQLNLVDLAGSERSGQTGATGLRFKEGTLINKSLSALALVIKQLSEDRNKHANYRDSKLTRILQNSLGGNAKTSIICAVTPAAVEETISTLQFANRAKAIKNTPAVNAVATNASMIQSLTKQLSALKTQLENKKSVEQDNFNLQKQIGNLQRLIINGFGQRSNTSLVGGARRKLQQPRRVTISTLHSIQEDPLPPAPRFCTPSLKYNPLSLNTLPEFVPSQRSSSLCSVAEEPRVITPPPTDKKVTISEEIIELDSDDDSPQDVQTCSPYHGCYQSTKTPPCILRKKAKEAEKNLKDIEELTDREKIYAPNVVELMEKLEKKSLEITELEENINKLNELSMEKDKVMERLKLKISEVESEIKDITSAKTTLETECKDYTTKLNDLEVSYETFQKKAKRREEELLSLLHEHEIKKKNEKIGRISSNSLEKDYTTSITSNNENIIINVEETKLLPVLCSNSDLETKLRLKEQTIFQLETELQAHKHKIDSLDNINKEFQVTISNLKEKTSSLENEIVLQKSTIDSLNTIIESQNSENEAVKADIQSYNDVIKELQVKLSDKENIFEDVNESDLETMIENEELFIANNENMKNILQCIKTALVSRKEEITNLKLSLDKNSTQNFKSLEQELDTKKKEISLLVKEVETLKEQMKDNVAIIDNLTLEKDNLLAIEQRLKIQLSELQSVKEVLENKTEVYILEIANLTKCKEDLTLALVKKESEFAVDINKVQTEVDKLSEEVFSLQNGNKTKDNIIAELQIKQKETQDNLATASKILKKVQNIMTLLSGNILEVPQMVESLVTAFGTLNDNLTSLESIAINIVKEKSDIRTLAEHHEKTLLMLKSQIDDLDNAINVFYNDNERYTNIVLENKICSSDKNTNQNLEYQMNNVTDKIKITLQYLNKSLQDKDLELNDIKLVNDFKLESQNAKYLQQFEEITEMRDLFLANILQKATVIISHFGIDNSISCAIDVNSEITYEQIVVIFDKIIQNILILKSGQITECDNIKGILTEAKKEIYNLTQENLKLSDDLSNLEKLQQDLIAKTRKIQMVETSAKEWKDKFRDLEESMKLQVDMLKIENIELKTKYSDLEVQCKQSYSSIDHKTNFASGDQKYISRKSTDYLELNSPPSLVTICCQRIFDFIGSNIDDKLESSSSTSSDSKNISNNCQCIELTAELNILQKENVILKNRIKQLKLTNDCLVKEESEAKKELQLLVEIAQDLQKKVINHRTNLSTLTATTYAENKSLSSQLKFLQYHHNRFHNVCQKDLPDFKKQLQDIMILLKSENVYKQNESFKRHSLPNALDINSLFSKLKNESTFESDLLMLDTNVTLTTCDNTLVGQDESCVDVTSVCTYNEVACQTSLNEITSCNLLYSQTETQSVDCTKILEALKSLKIENHKLRNLVDEYCKTKESTPIETERNNETDNLMKDNELGPTPHKCDHCDDIRELEEAHKMKMDTMSNKLIELESQKRDIQQKYRNLSLEVPSTELLVQKINGLEEERCTKQSEINKCTQTLRNKNEELKHLQEENDILSNQVMESISELDDLKKEYDLIKEMNTKLTENHLLLNKEIDVLKTKNGEVTCLECKLKSEIINTLENKLATEAHIKVDRSYSDSDRSSRCNKICTLQSELHAGKEDCKELKEEVTTIKNHLEHSNLSISEALCFDDNMENSHMYAFDEDFDNLHSQQNKCNISNIPGESLAFYNSDKETCLNYYAEKTGTSKESLPCDVKLIDIMKMLYENIESKHANEIENLVNKLKDFEESKKVLHETLNDIKIENVRVMTELQEKNSYFQTMANVVSRVRKNTAVLNDLDDCQDIVLNFKENFLDVVDKEFGFASAVVFELTMQHLHKNHTAELGILRNDNIKLEDDVQQINKKLNSVNENLSALKSQLTEKENEFNLLQRQKQKVHEISGAVTLDIIKREEDLRKQITTGFHELIDKTTINSEIDLSLPTNELIEQLFKFALNQSSHGNKEQYEKEKNTIIKEVEYLKNLLEVKEKELETSTIELAKTHSDFSKRKQEFKTQHDNLNNIYLLKVEENDGNVRLLKKLTEEVNTLNEALLTKNTLVTSLEIKLNTIDKTRVENESKISELLNSVANLQKEIEKLKSVNQIILTEKENYSMELEKACAIINHNKIDLDKMTTDILALKESVKERSTVIDNLRKDIETLGQLKESLVEKNKLLQEQVQEKCKNCSRLEINIKTHEKTAEIQSRMIIRLQKQKEEDDKLACEKESKLEELTQKYKSLETECEKLTKDIKFSTDEVETLRNEKLLLETRISDLEEEVHNHKRRLSLEAAAESTRRRRQSIHDSKRMFADDVEENKNIEAVFKSRPVAEDLFMNVDDNSSSRSTPVMMSRERDSLSKLDQSDKDEDQSRSSSVLASRRRRQSAHDSRRSVRQTPEPHENSHESSRNNSIESEVTQLRKQLSSCHQELEELKEKYRELDEECETCAEYLRERDEQCSRLKREKRDLESTLADLQDKLKNSNPNSSLANAKTSFAHASVNTDEDWANLHSVVVDRMSYDAEVEKNKRLMKTIEELRFKKQELKTTVAKMHKALEKHSVKDKELEATKGSLAACDCELKELRERYKELDEECETCASYLRERDEQCRKLKEAKAALESKLQEYLGADGALRSGRKKRHALHDQRRPRSPATVDVATETSDDLLAYHVERDNINLTTDDNNAMELKRLKMRLEKVSQQKTELEQQLSATPLYVATGSAIVQNQQITDVIKENRKLKKMNAKLVMICKKRDKSLTDSNRENEDPTERIN